MLEISDFTPENFSLQKSENELRDMLGANPAHQACGRPLLGVRVQRLDGCQHVLSRARRGLGPADAGRQPDGHAGGGRAARGFAADTQLDR